MRKSTLTVIMIALFLAAIPGVLVAQPRFLWQQDYGGEDEDYCYNLIETSDGGFMLVGSDWSFGPAISDAWIIKTDEDGDSLWAQEFTELKFKSWQLCYPVFESCFNIGNSQWIAYVV